MGRIAGDSPVWCSGVWEEISQGEGSTTQLTQDPWELLWDLWQLLPMTCITQEYFCPLPAKRVAAYTSTKSEASQRHLGVLAFPSPIAEQGQPQTESWSSQMSFQQFTNVFFLQ